MDAVPQQVSSSGSAIAASRASLSLLHPLFLSDIAASLFAAPDAARAPASLNRVAVRTRFFDLVASHAAQEGAEQFVFLGAGCCGRARRLPSLRGASVFELDLPEVLAGKRAKLASLPAAAAVAYVPCDLRGAVLRDLLRPAGFDPALRTCVLAEGLFYYLEPAVVSSLLEQLSSLCPELLLCFSAVSAAASPPSSGLPSFFRWRDDDPASFAVSAGFPLARNFALGEPAGGCDCFSDYLPSPLPPPKRASPGRTFYTVAPCYMLPLALEVLGRSSGGRVVPSGNFWAVGQAEEERYEARGRGGRVGERPVTTSPAFFAI
ncbi:hypothetical protein TeGR_g13805 [Tetraparma gracilis]|uniref:Leucine carboxyl methyltransferase n=1 Tax=Tetraparma gracilis TaxID=2962635 RepID=A0ABQ6MC27_9STRA|nr:hypothetical protein TeGR_g13805 [Tetraparma gracilis]